MIKKLRFVFTFYTLLATAFIMVACNTATPAVLSDTPAPSLTQTQLPTDQPGPSQIELEAVKNKLTNAHIKLTEQVSQIANLQLELEQLYPLLTPSITPTIIFTPTPTSTFTPTSTPTTSYGGIPENAIVIYLTHIGTGGPVACGDSLVAIMTGHVRTGDIEKDIELAVNTLFSVGQYSVGLYNATYPSSLRFGGVDISKGEAHVQLGGSYIKPKDSCDASRYRAQVWTTIQQFPEVNRAVPWVGNKLLGDLLAVYSDSGK